MVLEVPKVSFDCITRAVAKKVKARVARLIKNVKELIQH